MSESQDRSHPPLDEVGDIAAGGADRLADMSEVGLLLELAEMSDLIDAHLALREERAELAGWLLDACAALARIEDELMQRGFSYRMFCA
jgi:hypothetical protein